MTDTLQCNPLCEYYLQATRNVYVTYRLQNYTLYNITNAYTVEKLKHPASI